MMRTPKDETNISAGDNVIVEYGGDGDYVCGWISAMDRYVGKVCEVIRVDYTLHKGCLMPFAKIKGSTFSFDARYLIKADDITGSDEAFDDFINTYVKG